MSERKNKPVEDGVPLELGLDDVARIRRLMRAPVAGLRDPDSGKRVSQRVILAALRAIGEHWDGHGSSWPSYQTLHAMTGYSEKHLGRCFDALEAAGIVRKEQRLRQADGTYGSWKIRVNWGRLAMWVHPDERTRTIQALVDRNTAKHYPADPWSGGWRGDETAAHPADPSGPQRSEPADPRGPSQRTPEVRAEQQHEQQENNSSRDAAAGAPAAGGSVDDGLEARPTGEGEGERNSESCAPQEAESDAVRGVRELLVLRGVMGGVLDELVGYAAEGRLTVGEVRHEIDLARRREKGVGAVVLNLRGMAKARSARDARRMREAGARAAKAGRCGDALATDRDRIVAELADLCEMSIELRRRRGDRWKREEINAARGGFFVDAARKLGLRDQDQARALVDEVWDEVERRRGPEPLDGGALATDRPDGDGPLVGIAAQLDPLPTDHCPLPVGASRGEGSAG